MTVPSSLKSKIFHLIGCVNLSTDFSRSRPAVLLSFQWILKLPKGRGRSMVRALRVGAVSYLNTKPLITHLRETLPGVDLRLEVPSKLATDLAAGSIDVGLIPSIEYFRAGDYTIIPGAAIASVGPVMSVKLCSRKPFREIKKIAEDEGSRTSRALLRILLKRLFQVDHQSVPLPLDVALEAVDADAVLVIGDRAMRIRDGEYPYVLDLGYEWSRWTGLPFVWAFWSVRPGLELEPAEIAAFAKAKELGRPDVSKLAREEAAKLGLPAAQCEYYLQQVIRHDFGEEEIAGLLRFRELAVEAGLAPEGVRCVFQHPGRLVESR
jgi:chorismate dehydratase